MWEWTVPGHLFLWLVVRFDYSSRRQRQRRRGAEAAVICLTVRVGTYMTGSAEE